MAELVRDVQMSASNSRRDLRLKLEGCSTCDDSEDETIQEQTQILPHTLSSPVKTKNPYYLLHPLFTFLFYSRFFFFFGVFHRSCCRIQGLTWSWNCTTRKGVT